MTNKALEKKHKKKLDRAEKIKQQKLRSQKFQSPEERQERFRQGRIQLIILFILLAMATFFIVYALN